MKKCKKYILPGSDAEGRSFRILVVSDTHGRNLRIGTVIEKEEPIDAVIHCGDSEGDPASVVAEHSHVPFYGVRGNCDWSGTFPEELIICAGKHRIFVTHGHFYGVKYQNDALIRAARENSADIALFGHSHIPEVISVPDHGPLLCNPGSLTLPHQESHIPTYCILTLPADGPVNAELKAYKTGE